MSGNDKYIYGLPPHPEWCVLPSYHGGDCRPRDIKDTDEVCGHCEGIVYDENEKCAACGGTGKEPAT